jgi:trans-aconitate methyltransferase
MELRDRAAIVLYHRACVEAYGRGTTAALGWKSPQSQLARFEILAEIGDLNRRSLLDVGCGHGDLRGFLGARYPELDYLGIDHFEPFLEVAAERYGAMPRTSFLLGDFTTAPLPEVDYVLASGALGYRAEEPGFALRMIDKLFAACRVALGVNLIARRPSAGAAAGAAESVLTAHDRDAVLAHCQQLAPRVVVREGYFEDDFTVFLYRG